MPRQRVSRELMHRLAAYLRLVRPLNLVITAIGVYVGAALSMGRVTPPAAFVSEVVAACVSAVLVAAGGNCINDVFDVQTDAVNRPNRPIPSGRVTPAAARGLWIVTTAAGIVIAAFVSAAHLAMAVLAAALLYAYSSRFKRAPFTGNVIVAFVVALAIVYGGWAVGSPAPAYVAAAFAFLTTFARELIKDVEDIVGDRAVHAQTAPIVFGLAAARRAAAVVLILTVLLTPMPFLTMDYGSLFLFLVLVADLMLLRVIWLLPHTARDAPDASAWLKGAMVTGLVALFAA